MEKECVLDVVGRCGRHGAEAHLVVANTPRQGQLKERRVGSAVDGGRRRLEGQAQELVYMFFKRKPSKWG